MEHTKHIWRAILLLVVIGTGGFVLRHFLIPESFGEMGHYRYNSVYEYMAQEPLYQGDQFCGNCHTEQFKAKSGGKHAPIRCEVCHGTLSVPIEKHNVPAEPGAEKGTRTPEEGGMTINRSPDLCAYCHRALDARPDAVPQIDFKEHLVTLGAIEAGDPIPDQACIVCHDVHSPSMQ